MRIEINLYIVSTSEGERVSTGITDTYNPSNVGKAISALVKLIVKQMQDEGILRLGQER